MSLHNLAPSIAPLGNTDRAPDGYPDPTNRLTVLLGAGASLFARAPSTQNLTDVVASREISGAILRALQSDPSTRSATFEDVLHVLEELEALATSSARPPTMLRPFLAPVLSKIGTSPEKLRLERYDLLEAIAIAFDPIDYDTMWRPLYRLLRPQLDIFDLDIFTLNYDLIPDVTTYALATLSGKSWFDGFAGPVNLVGHLGFNPSYYANWSPHFGRKALTLAHLHGSLSYAYHASDRRMAHAVPFELTQTSDPRSARETWQWAREAAAKDLSIDFGGIKPIVSGLRKLEKLNVQPFANYYVGFAQAVSKSPYLMLVGYGAGDDHINYWLREYTLIHGEMARVVEVTRSSETEHFAMQRFGAYDLQWSKFKERNDAYVNSAGVHCLTITGGLTRDREFDERLINAQFSGALRY